jgi:hypothetical protein
MVRRGALAVAGLALVVAGCGGDEQGGGGSDDTSTTPSPSPSSSEPSPSVTGLPETPTVESATGVELEADGFRINVPEKWRITNDNPFGVTAVGPVDDGRSGGVLLAAFGESQVSIAEAMRFSWQPGTKPPGFEEQPRTVLGGLSAFYYTAEGNKFLTEHVMGMWDSGFTIELNIALPNALSPERQKEIVDSIVATYRRPGE